MPSDSSKTYNQNHKLWDRDSNWAHQLRNTANTCANTSHLLLPDMTPWKLKIVVKFQMFKAIVLTKCTKLHMCSALVYMLLMNRILDQHSLGIHLHPELIDQGKLQTWHVAIFWNISPPLMPETKLAPGTKMLQNFEDFKKLLWRSSRNYTWLMIWVLMDQILQRHSSES